MDFVIIANAWTAVKDNPTSKHQIAIELAKQGHRVLWVNGAGMRKPDMGSGADRSRIVGRLLMACRGATRVRGVDYKMKAVKRGDGKGGNEEAEFTLRQKLEEYRKIKGIRSAREIKRKRKGTASPKPEKSFNVANAGGVWAISPLLIPLSSVRSARLFNGWLCRVMAQRAARKLGFRNPVLINYVPVLVEAMKGWGRGKDEGGNPARNAAPPAALCAALRAGHSAAGGLKPERVERDECKVQGERGAGEEIRGQKSEVGEESGERSTRLRSETSGVAPLCRDKTPGQVLNVQHSSVLTSNQNPGPRTQEPLNLNTEHRTLNTSSRVRVVYHCVDRWDAFGMYDSAMMAELDAACCKCADLVISSSLDLAERCRRLNPNTWLVTHGVDHVHFASAIQGKAETGNLKPEEDGEAEDVELSINNKSAVPAPGGTVGFFGLLSEWIDQDLIVQLARELPDSEIVLVGKADVDISKLKQEKNIKITGSRPFNELPEVVRHFDVGIIPFVVSDLTKAVNPIKLREMLAAGCPVVSTALPEVESLARRVGPGKYAKGGAIAVAQNKDEFVALVKDRLRNPLTVEEKKNLSESVRCESWGAKVGEILALIKGAKRA